MRPIVIVEDPVVRELVRYTAGELGDVAIKMPTRGEIRTEIQKFATALRKELGQRIASDCDGYLLTTDFWTDKSMRSFIGLTLHYADSDFNPSSWVLGIKHFPGKHDSPRIKLALENMLEAWGLDTAECMMLLRDGAANGKRATKDLGVPNMSCLSHSLHLVLAGALIRKGKRGLRGDVPTSAKQQVEKGQRSSEIAAPVSSQCEPLDGAPTDSARPAGTTFVTPLIGGGRQLSENPTLPNHGHADTPTHDSLIATTPMPYGILPRDVCDDEQSADAALDEGDDEDVDEGDEVTAHIVELREDACHDLEDYLATNHAGADLEALDKIRAVVARFRALSTFFHRSSKAKDQFHAIQVEAKVTPNELLLDCPTRWNSTWMMLHRFLRVRIAVKAFFKYLESQKGIAEFPDHRKIPRIQKDDWFAATCLEKLLNVFAVVSALLGGDRYPTMILVLPSLLTIQQDLENLSLFDEVVQASPAQPYVREGTRLMHRVRRAILKLFKDRFRNLRSELAWMPALDPRASNMRYLTPPEREFAAADLVEALATLTRDAQSPSTPIQVNTPPSSLVIATPQKQFELLYARIYARTQDEDSPAVNATQSTDVDDIRQQCEDDVSLYLTRAIRTTHLKSCPMAWLHVNGKDYPLLKRLARKWFGCVASSVPCERAFSSSGNVINARRTRLAPDLVEDLMFIAQNYKPPPK